jgi:5-formyltetrahydrofolate cyclo-ligase
MEHMSTAKSVARAGLLAARAARPAGEIATARASIAARLLARAADWRTVAAYRPLRTEPGSRELLDDLVGAGIRVIVPVLLDDRDLDWTTWPALSDRLGVSAIAAADVVLVPALAVDSGGTRLGRGGGSYDRALTRVDSSTPTIALLFDGELVTLLPADPWDVPVRAVVTPSAWHGLDRG